MKIRTISNVNIIDRIFAYRGNAGYLPLHALMPTSQRQADAALAPAHSDRGLEE